MKSRAFSLIELMIAVLILSVVIISIYGVFSAGIKAWQRGSEDRDFKKIRIGLLKIQKELRSSFIFSEAPFKGASSQMTFPVIVKEEDREKICMVSYYIAEAGNSNAGGKVIMRRAEEADKPIFFADSIDFEYAHEPRDGSEGLEWERGWEGYCKKIPLAVKINFTTGADKDIYHKTIFIPQGVLSQNEK